MHSFFSCSCFSFYSSLRVFFSIFITFHLRSLLLFLFLFFQILCAFIFQNLHHFIYLYSFSISYFSSYPFLCLFYSISLSIWTPPSPSLLFFLFLLLLLLLHPEVTTMRDNIYHTLTSHSLLGTCVLTRQKPVTFLLNLHHKLRSCLVYVNWPFATSLCPSSCS